MQGRSLKLDKKNKIDVVQYINEMTHINRLKILDEDVTFKLSCMVIFYPMR